MQGRREMGEKVEALRGNLRRLKGNVKTGGRVGNGALLPGEESGLYKFATKMLCAIGWASGDGLEGGDGVESLLEGLDLPLLGLEMGIGGVMGFAVGFFLKKSIKLLFLLLGFLIFIMVFLDQLGMIIIRWGAVEEAYDAVVREASARDLLFGFLEWLTRRIPLGGGLIAGFLLGFKVG